MLVLKEIFEVDKAMPYLSMEYVDGDVVKEMDIRDTNEKPRKLLYNLVELFIYFGWPFVVCLFLSYVFSLNPLLMLPLFFVMVFWPVIKNKIGVRIAMKNGIKDPRHAIKSSSFWCDGFLFFGVPVLKEVRRYSALSRSLDCIYNLTKRFDINPSVFKDDWHLKVSPFKLINFLIKKWNDFWFKMPIAQDVRTRLAMVSREITRLVESINSKNIKNGDRGKKIKIALLAGGTKQDVIMAVKDLLNKDADLNIEVVCVEPDGLFAIHRSKELMDIFGVNKYIFRDISKKVYIEPDNKKTLKDILLSEGYSFADFDLVVCVGLGDYMYDDKISLFIKMLDNGRNIITANISGNLIERFFMHFLLQWPKMQYLSLKQYKRILIRALGIDRKITIYRTPNKIFNIAVIEEN